MKDPKVTYLDHIPHTPARVRISTGELQVSKSHFKKYSKDIQRFIILHEFGHYHLKTKDELKADAYAIKRYMKEGRSSRQAVYALSRVLNFSSPEHIQRLRSAFNLIRLMDAHVNGNTKLLKFNKK